MNRPDGHPQFTFLHFVTPIEILENGEILRAPSHACVLYAPKERQYFHSPKNLVHDWIHFTAPPDYPARFGIQTGKIYFPERAEFITQLTREIEQEFFASGTYKDELLSCKLDELFIKFRRAVLRESHAELPYNTTEALRGLRGEVFSHLTRRWTVKEMAKKTGLSESRFYATYKSLYGVSPIEDLIRARMDSAKNALAYTDESVGAIAETLGFENLSHFIRQFTAREGVSPTLFRKKQK